jgi:predicted DNA-binding transcriptional regulator AlpA
VTTAVPTLNVGRHPMTSRDVGRQQRWTPSTIGYGACRTSPTLGIPHKTLYNWRTRGIGPRARRVGRYLRYDEHDVRAWFAAQNETVR